MNMNKCDIFNLSLSVLAYALKLDKRNISILTNYNKILLNKIKNNEQSSVKYTLDNKMYLTNQEILQTVKPLNLMTYS